MTNRRVASALGSLAIVLALAACTPTATPEALPSATPPRTATPTGTPTAEIGPAALIVVSGDSLRIDDAEGATIGSYLLRDTPDALVDALTAAFGVEAAVVEHTSADDCTAVGTADYSWTVDDSSLVITTASPKAVAPWDTLDVRIGVRSIGGVSLMTSAGFAVGDDVTEFIDRLPVDERNEFGAFIWDRVSTYDTHPFGGTAFADESGIVTFVGAPGLMQSWYC